MAQGAVFYCTGTNKKKHASHPSTEVRIQEFDNHSRDALALDIELPHVRYDYLAPRVDQVVYCSVAFELNTFAHLYLLLPASSAKRRRWSVGSSPPGRIDGSGPPKLYADRRRMMALIRSVIKSKFKNICNRSPTNPLKRESSIKIGRFGTKRGWR